jgi:hypothetical protein
MKRALLVVSSLLLLLVEGGSSHARPQSPPEPAAPSPGPQAPAATPRDPLEEFVPSEKLEADSVVALPVDI